MPPTEEGPALAAALRKAAWRIVPFLLLLYVLAFLDRVNLSYAKQSFLRDTGLGDEAYAFGAGIFFLAYALFEIPSNLILHRVGARVWLCRIMVTWGLISAATMFAHSARSFYLLRFLLGAAEAGFFPGVILYLTYWFPARTRYAILGSFYFGAPLSQIFGGPLSGYLLELNGRCGLQGWQWLFLVEGALAVPAGVWAFFYLTDRPERAAWLPEAERSALVRRMESEHQGIEAIGGRHTLAALARPRVLYFGLIYIFIQATTYGVTFYIPSQIAGLFGRETGLWVGLVSAIPWLCALAAVFLLPLWARRTGRRAWVAGGALAVAAAGIAASACGSPVFGLIALSVATAGFMGAQPIFWTFPTGELTGAGAAGGIALVNSVGALGSFGATNLRAAAERLGGTPLAGLAAMAAVTALGAVLMFSLSEPPAVPAPLPPRE
ncbi:MAG TPA: MFS transporter [Opitutaceae bacterium]|nr:MFS transporter [Opitutaceae bacterium]